MTSPQPSERSNVSVIPAPFAALLIANMRAAELRAKALGEERAWPPAIMRGAPTHSCAFLLQALEEQGWTVSRMEEAR